MSLSLSLSLFHTCIQLMESKSSEMYLLCLSSLALFNMLVVTHSWTSLSLSLYLSFSLPQVYSPPHLLHLLHLSSHYFCLIPPVCLSICRIPAVSRLPSHVFFFSLSFPAFESFSVATCVCCMHYKCPCLWVSLSF